MGLNLSSFLSISVNCRTYINSCIYFISSQCLLFISGPRSAYILTPSQTKNIEREDNAHFSSLYQYQKTIICELSSLYNSVPVSLCMHLSSEFIHMIVILCIPPQSSYSTLCCNLQPQDQWNIRSLWKAVVQKLYKFLFAGSCTGVICFYQYCSLGKKRV